jgi:hypothetical protein
VALRQLLRRDRRVAEPLSVPGFNRPSIPPFAAADS